MASPLETLAADAEAEDPTKIAIDFDPTVERMQGYAAHGMTPFDMPIISKILPGLWQGGTDPYMTMPDFVEHFVTLYPWESYQIKHALKSSLAVRMYDSVGQGFDQVDEIARWVLNRWNDAEKTGEDTLVVCQAGLNRSSLIVARVLTMRGMSGQEAVDQIRQKRSPACLCNPAFLDWILSL